MSKNKNYFEEDENLNKLCEKLDALRKEGTNKISSLKKENALLMRNKFISEEERKNQLTENNHEISKAKETAKKNKDEIKATEKLALLRCKEIADEYIKKIHADQDELIELLKTGHKKKIRAIKEDFIAKKKAAKSKEEIKEVRLSKKAALTDAKNRFFSTTDLAKTVRNQAYIDFVHKNQLIRNGRESLKENIFLSLQNFIYTFNLTDFLLNNGLYLTIILFFVTCVIIAPLSGNGNLLTLYSLFDILEQSSVRMFYALGVAGLILLSGTDLSVGRMVALGAVTTGLLLHPGENVISVFGLAPWDFTFLPMGIRVLLALFFSIILCVAFSSFSGVFTAKLKIHPFITTLATQLIIYGLLFYGTKGTPVGSIDRGIKDLIGGRWILGTINGQTITFPKLIIPATIAVFVTWFIWNKTVFGKHMYAVGGNAEAAIVSGINVFRVTMGVFVMAGILYGCGSFLEIFKANASASTGQGYELDAIAACVVGGISFNGGVGKISGAIIGVLSFTALTYCLTFLGVDTNLQFVFKGLIIFAAVALDNVKNLRRK